MSKKPNIRILPFYKRKGYRCPWCGMTYKGLPPPGCNKCWTVRKCGTFIPEAQNGTGFIKVFET